MANAYQQHRPTRLLIHGANGRMGHALQRMGREGEGCEIVAAVSRKVESRAIEGIPQFAASELGGVP
jgi:4-hydroxy-tetrahydrodipicolinate reductase